MMNLETKQQLSDETVAKLQDLIRINIDSQKGFEAAADVIDNDSIATLLRDLGCERAAHAQELRSYVQWNDEEPVKDGSYAASLHRLWMDARAKLSGGDPHVVLCEAEKGEDQIKQAYEDALQETAGSALNSVLTAQYAAVKRAHDRVRDLRDGFAKTS